MAKQWKCPTCGAANERINLLCEYCGWERVASPARRTLLGLHDLHNHTLPDLNHRCTPDPDTGFCQCGTRVNTRAQGKQFMQAIMDVAIGRRMVAEVQEMIDAAFEQGA